MLIMSITKTGNNRPDKIRHPNVTFPFTLIFFYFVFFFFFFFFFQHGGTIDFINNF